VQVGNYGVQALALPGHSKDSICYLLTQGDYRVLFSGDAIFNGGAIALLNHQSSSLDDYRTHIGKFQGLEVDALLPAHFTWTLRDGQHYLDKLIKNLSEMIIPPPQWTELLSALGERPVIK
jgi:glyoxylase-like metal-dependent hydrolase (beta-lactamase superfamily II)